MKSKIQMNLILPNIKNMLLVACMLFTILLARFYWICDNDYIDNDVKVRRSLSYHWKI